MARTHGITLPKRIKFNGKNEASENKTENKTWPAGMLFAPTHFEQFGGLLESLVSHMDIVPSRNRWPVYKKVKRRNKYQATITEAKAETKTREKKSHNKSNGKSSPER